MNKAVLLLYLIAFLVLTIIGYAVIIVWGILSIPFNVLEWIITKAIINAKKITWKNKK